MTTTRPLLRIGAAAAEVGLSLRTVRYWEEIGLVRPTQRSKGGFRLYSEADLHRLLVIKAMKPLGLTLEEMRELLELLDAAAAPAQGTSLPIDVVHQRLGALAERVRLRVERMERDVNDARVLLTELKASLDAVPRRHVVGQ